MKRLNQSGSHLLVVLLAALVLGVITFTAYKVLDARSDDSAEQTTATQAPETIKNSEDLDQTSAALDDSTAQLDSGLDDTELDADLNSML